MKKSEFGHSETWNSSNKKLTYKRTPTARELSLHLENFYRSHEFGGLEIFFSHGKHAYRLVLEYQDKMSNASWKFYRDDQTEADLLWQRDSGDAIMIHNLVSSTIEKTIGDLVQSTKVAEKSKNSQYQEKLEKPSIESGLLSSLKKIFGARPSNELDALIDSNFGRNTLGQIALTDLGILSYPAFLFCLIKEFKSNDDRTPLTILIFKLTLSGRQRTLHLPKPIVKEIIDRVKKLQRTTDVIGQYDVPNTFAVMLPEANLEGAKYFANRLQAMLAKLSSLNKFSNGVIKSSFALATISERCDSVEKILGAADMTMTLIERNGISTGVFDECFPNDSPQPKNINENIVQNMIGQLIVQPYGIFSYSALIAFMAHHFERAKRTKRKTYVLVMSLVKLQQKREDPTLLAKAKSSLVERLMAEDSRFLLAEYKDNGIAIIAAKAGLSNLPGFAKQITKSLENTPLLNDEVVQPYKVETKLYQIDKDKKRPQIIKLNLAKTL